MNLRNNTKFYLLFLCIFTATACGGDKLESLCSFENGLCYIDKPDEFKTPLQMDNYYCVNEVEFQKILTRLRECKENGCRLQKQGGR